MFDTTTRVVCGLALAVASGCATSLAASTAAGEKATEVARPAGQPLGALRMARVDAAHANLQPALAEWKLAEFGQDCILLFSEAEEWLLGCPELAGTSGFVATGEQWRGKPVLFNPSSFVMSETRVPYEKVKLTLVGTVGNYTSEHGGVREERPVLMLQEWTALHANHPGSQTSNIEEWLGIFVHEAFHGHQLFHPRVRAVVKSLNSEKGLATADELAAFYKQNATYKEAVKKEYDLLRAASDDATLDPAKARSALGQWLSLYRLRQQAFEPELERALPGKKAWQMDGFELFLEGTARYVEAKFLMAPADGTQAGLGDEATFKRFIESKGKKPSALVGLGNLGGKYFYALGMYLCFVLDVAEPNWKQTLFTSDGLLVGEVERVAGAKP